MNNKIRYLGKNTFLFGISSFGTKILSFLLVPLYTSVLSTSEYGTADLITTTATLLIFTLTIDIADSVTRFTLDIQNGVNDFEIVNSGIIVNKGLVNRKSKQEAILSYGNRVIVISTLICALGLGLVFWSGKLLWPAYYYLFVLLYFFSTAFYQVMSNYLRGIDKVASVAISGVVSSLTTIVSNILFLLIFKFGLVGYLLSMIMGPMIASFYSMIVSDAPISVYFVNSCSKPMAAEMRKYCIPLIFNNVALWVNAFLDRYFVTAMCGIDQNGIYSVASKIPSILAVCYSIFGQAWNLSAIKEFDPEDKDGFFGKTYKVFNALMTLACSGIILFNIPLSRFLYSKDFFTAWKFSSVLLISVMFNALTMFIGGVFSAVKKTKVIAWTTVISAICNTLLNSLLIPCFGPLGAAVATAVAYCVMWIVRLFYSRKYIRFKINILIDCFVYALLCLQVIFEHLSGHLYIGQICCFTAIFVIYYKQITLLSSKILINVLHIHIKNKNE